MSAAEPLDAGDGADARVRMDRMYRLTRHVYALVRRAEKQAGVLKQSDVVTLHCPLMPSTRNMIGAAQLRSMKPTAKAAGRTSPSSPTRSSP